MNLHLSTVPVHRLDAYAASEDNVHLTFYAPPAAGQPTWTQNYAAFATLKVADARALAAQLTKAADECEQRMQAQAVAA